MLFNSYAFIFVFLPITFLGYFILNKLRLYKPAVIWLALASLCFYSWWNVAYLPLLLGSMAVNYSAGYFLQKDLPTHIRKWILFSCVSFNIGLLGYFKYMDFFIANINEAFNASFALPHIALPLAISFFTFQQTAFLVDAYHRDTTERKTVNYVLFVTFFPHLIAGPIVHHKEMMPQFDMPRKKKLNYRNISVGLFLFFAGLAKKVWIADTLAVWANAGFDGSTSLAFFEAWFTSLAYTFQLYFDFSGYTDMATGAALLFNIKLPVNFMSPYKSLNITEFWKRWHMTLTRFMTRYLYIPLGGNRRGPLRTYVNLLLVFLISGLWHGAGWTFVFWGFLHGIATVIHRCWIKLGWKMRRWLAWLITFQFVNVSWIFFRAKEWEDALKVLRGMFGLNAAPAPGNSAIGAAAFYMLVLCFVITLGMKNTNELSKRLKVNTGLAIAMAAGITYLLLSLNKMSEFLYFNF